MSQPEVIPEVLSADLPDGVFLLDVREDDEWVAGHAPDAMHLKLGELAARNAEVPRDREVYLICRGGARSAYAAQVLASQGWQAINVADGMTGYRPSLLLRLDDQRDRCRALRRVDETANTRDDAGSRYAQVPAGPDDALPGHA